jgi:hypothetical protein
VTLMRGADTVTLKMAMIPHYGGAMSFLKWSKSRVEYGRKLLNSAAEGARAGEGEFLGQRQRGPYLGESARKAVAPAVIGVCLGALGGYLGKARRSRSRALVSGLLGGAVGLSAGVIWDSRHLTASVASGAWKKIGETRDDRWFEKNPITYA